jgi:hypothetical protein
MDPKKVKYTPPKSDKPIDDAEALRIAKARTRELLD